MTAQTLLSFLSILFVFVGTFVGAYYSRRTSKESNSTLNWDKYGERMESLYSTLQESTANSLQRQEERISCLERNVSARDDKIANLEERLSSIEGKYRSAVDYIRRLVNQLRGHVLAKDIERPPDNIEPDI